MLPANKSLNEYRSLDEIRERKDQLLDAIQEDQSKFSTLWGQIFLNKETSSKGDYIASLVGHGFVAVDTFLLIRKLVKGYGYLFGRKKKK